MISFVSRHLIGLLVVVWLTLGFGVLRWIAASSSSWDDAQELASTYDGSAP